MPVPKYCKCITQMHFLLRRSQAFPVLKCDSVEPVLSEDILWYPAVNCLITDSKMTRKYGTVPASTCHYKEHPEASVALIWGEIFKL